MSDSTTTQSDSMAALYANRGLVFVRGEGVYLVAEDGRRYLDLTSNYGVNILGYGHRAVEEAVVAQWRRLPTLHCSFGNDVRARASAALVERVGVPDGRVYWCNSGAEAMEAALKFAVMATGRRRFIACRNGYHGKTLGALSATSGAKYREAFEPLLWEFRHVPYDDPAALASEIDSRTAAVIVEPVQGEGGVLVPRPGYLRSLREICSARSVLLILDEVQTGNGRTGRFLAAEHEGVRADITCLGKGLAGGVPVGATAMSAEVASHLVKGSHSSTFGGNPLALAGVLAVLAALDEALLHRVAGLGERFLKGLRGMESELVSDVRGLGLMLGVEVRERRDDVLRALQRRRVLAVPAGANVVRFLPPFVIAEEQVDQAVSALQAVLRAL